MHLAFCPECDQRLRLGANLRVGQPITCPVCKTKLQIIGLNPLELDAREPETRVIAKVKQVVESPCPECEDSVNLGTRPHEGQRLVCPACKTPLEIVSLDPLEIDVSFAGWRRPVPKTKDQKWGGRQVRS
jgi:uncharacterized paraquat-inducible protein A